MISVLENEGFENILNQLIIYPNPVENILNINSTGDEMLDKVIVLNNLGQVVLETRLNENRVYLTELNSGVYFIKVIGEKQIYNLKIIKK